MRPSLLPSRPRKPLFGCSSTSYSTSSSSTPSSSSAASSASAMVRPVVSTHSIAIVSTLGDRERSHRFGPSTATLQRRLRFLLFRRRAPDVAGEPDPELACVLLLDPL